jgi:signal transduction histidine kinase
MSDLRAPRLPIPAPTVAPPRSLVERRRSFRREADGIAHEETRLLARTLDVLAAAGEPETRLAGLLDLLADTVGAIHAAVVADDPVRRVAVAAAAHDDAEEARVLALGSWLDAAAPRSRARRAAAGPAPISVARHDPHRTRSSASKTVAGGPWYGLLAIPSAGEVALGFEFAAPIEGAVLAERLPPAMARHAAVALALVTDGLATARALAELRAREAERERFVSTVAHELRTPLTGLSGYLDLILDGRVGDAAVEREFLERGRTIVGSMAGLVGDLLELSRLESGSLQLESSAFSIAEVMSTVASGLLPIALDRGVDLRSDPPPRLHAATGDRRRVEQILTNLAANALKFGSDGGRVELAGRSEGPVAIMAVRDDGAGIEPDDRSRIFERFYRLTDHERVTGTGLGLPIARELARAMGGDLDVASLPEVGSSFVLVMPGPVGADPSVIADTLRQALAAESERLNDRALRRAGAKASAETARDRDEQRNGGPADPRGGTAVSAGAAR